MELGYMSKGLSGFYEVMHAWSVQEYFSKCGIKVNIIDSGDDNKNQTLGILNKIKKAISKSKSNSMSVEKYEEFIRNYLDIPDDSIEGRSFNHLEYIFDELILPKEHEYDMTEDECEGNYVSSIMLLNQKDYMKFIKPVDEKSPYILIYIENEETYKTDYINDFTDKQGMRKVVIADNAKNYTGAKEILNAGPEDILSLLFYADGIITDSLIVLELTVLFQKSFLYMNGGKGEGRAVLMLEQLELLDHFVHDPAAKTKTAKYGKVYSRTLWKQTIEARKQVIKLINRLFPKADIDKLDACECPTDITRTECYGCLACKEICPAKAITMYNDYEEFLFPFTNYHKCIECGLCKKICIRNKPPYAGYEEGFPLAASAKNNDKEVLFKSTSGAVFPELARYVIEEKKGAVVGVKYGEDVIDVRSDIAETMEEVEAFYGSKYVKSKYDGIFPRIKTLLDNDRYVLYSGLPCECAGLKSYLQKDYENLLICEILCHSVPSPRIYRKYVKYLQGKRKSKILDLVFRKKTETFAKMEITYRKGLVIQVRYGKNNYFRAFHNHYISRTSCSKCQFTYLKRTGDVTIGDFWGAQIVFPELIDKSGISCVLLNTKKGMEVFDKIAGRFDIKKLTAKEAFIKNHRKSKPLSPEREELFKLLNEGMQINDLLEKFNDLVVKPEIKEPEEEPGTKIIKETSKGAVPEVLTEADISDKDEE